MAHFIPNPLQEKSTVPEWGNNQKAHQACLIFDYSRKRTNTKHVNSKPRFQLVAMERMTNTCIAAPDINAYDPEVPNLKNHCYIFLKNRNEWKNIFFEHMEGELKSKEEADADEAESDDSFVKKAYNHQNYDAEEDFNIYANRKRCCDSDDSDESDGSKDIKK